MRSWRADKLFLLLIPLLILLSGFCGAEEGIYNLRVSAGEAKTYGLVKIDFDTDLPFINPYDPDDIAIDAVFTSPTGEEIVYPAFYNRTDRDLNEDFVPKRDGSDYRYNTKTKQFVFKPREGEHWTVRFSWGEPGAYIFRLEARVKGKTFTYDGGSFVLTESGEPGPLTLSPGGYLMYADSGEQFFPIGTDNAQHYDTAGYSRILDALSENGGNFCRVWSGTDYGYSSLTIENWVYGAGLYNLDMAQAFDRVLLKARQTDVKLSVCFDSFTALSRNETYYGQFGTYGIYGKFFGGFIDEPQEFWTNEDCRRTYQNRVRYLIARCGWDTNVALWELMNEIDGTNGFASCQTEAAQWVNDMCGYIRSVDPYARPVGVSFAGGDSAASSYPRFAAIAHPDFIQVHKYDATDVCGSMNLLVRNGKAFSGTVLVGEFGLSENYASSDAEFEYWRMGMWSGLMSGSACVPMYWYCDDLCASPAIEKLMAIRRFTDAFDFVSEGLTGVDASASKALGFRGLINDSGTRAAVYVWNKAYRWNNPNAVPAENARLQINHLQPGTYTVTIWDTENGEIRSELTMECSGNLIINLDTVARDIAVMVQAV